MDRKRFHVSTIVLLNIVPKATNLFSIISTCNCSLFSPAKYKFYENNAPSKVYSFMNLHQSSFVMIIFLEVQVYITLGCIQGFKSLNVANSIENVTGVGQQWKSQELIPIFHTIYFDSASSVTALTHKFPYYCNCVQIKQTCFVFSS